MASLQRSPVALDRPEVAGSDDAALVAPLLVLATTQTATYPAGRSAAPRGLTTAGIVAGGAMVVAAGTGLDISMGNGPGFGLTVSFLVACVAMALCLPARLVGIAVVAAPLLFATATTAIAYAAGDAQGLRQLALEVATGLALAAPVVFGGTGLAATIALGRLIGHVCRRSRLKLSGLQRNQKVPAGV